jgi:hypothetical protein
MFLFHQIERSAQIQAFPPTTPCGKRSRVPSEIFLRYYRGTPCSFSNPEAVGATSEGFVCKNDEKDNFVNFLHC